MYDRNLTITSGRDLEPWQQQHRESAKAYHAFCHLRDLPPDARSTDRGYRDHQRRCRGRQTCHARAAKTWWAWSAAWDWPGRLASYDTAQDRVARERIAKDQTDARVRHARMALANLQVLSVPAWATLEALQNPLVRQRLVDDAKATTPGFYRLLEMVILAARAVPGLIQCERLALNMTTDVVEIEERRVDNVSLRIAQDPTAVDLAIQLLDRVTTLGGEDADHV